MKGITTIKMQAVLSPVFSIGGMWTRNCAQNCYSNGESSTVLYFEAERRHFMSAERNLRPQAMTARDREFDALLRLAVQHFQQVTADMRTQRNISQESQRSGETNLRVAAYVAKG
jgi:hypothetical protein